MNQLAEPVPLAWPTIDMIKSLVCEHFKTAPVEMVSQRRARECARPRQFAMYLSATLTPHSLPVIGKHFGNRDHTTVLHAKHAVAARIEEKPDYKSDLETLMLDLFTEHLSLHGNIKFAAESVGKDEQWGNDQFTLICNRLGESVL